MMKWSSSTIMQKSVIFITVLKNIPQIYLIQLLATSVCARNLQLNKLCKFMSAEERTIWNLNTVGIPRHTRFTVWRTQDL